MGARVRALRGSRSLLIVPMLQEGRVLGTLNVSRAEGGFTERHIELLRTFADQAVIAIENVRLFQELEARNRKLTEVLEQQTATSEILQAISASPTDAQPVFDTIARRAVRVCEGTHGVVCRFDGVLVHAVAHSHGPPEGVEVIRQPFPIPRQPDTMAGRAILTGAVATWRTRLADPEWPDLRRDPRQP